MKSSKNAIEIIKFYESFRSAPYLCPAGVPTIGYGTTVYPNGKKVKLIDGLITKDQAVEFLVFSVQDFEAVVKKLVKTDLDQNEFDALISFLYNFGETKFASSTLLQMLNSGKKIDAANQFDRWVFSLGKIQKGLVKRRKTEKTLFLTGRLEF